MWLVRLIYLVPLSLQPSLPNFKYTYQNHERIATNCHTSKFLIRNQLPTYSMER